jgi:hypothetical protein
MSEKYFSLDGRCVTNFTKKNLIVKSRNYFQIDKEAFKKKDLKNIFDNIKSFLCPNDNIRFTDFEKRLKNLEDKISLNDNLKNVQNNFMIPFFLPKKKIKDIGEELEKIYLPALSKSFEKTFPKYKFINHCKESLKNQIEIKKKSRYEDLLNKTADKNIVGFISPSLNEFSEPAAIDTINSLPTNIIGAGGLEILSCLIGNPALLQKKENYSPLLWFTAYNQKNNENLSYHVEQYGYNLTFNRRIHLNLAAEYWWHSIVFID